MHRRQSEELDERSTRLLHAYHDGELSSLARWRFERRLAAAPELRRELRLLRRMREAARNLDAQQPAPDLWDSIAFSLPAEEARRGDEATSVGMPGQWKRGPAGGMSAWLKPAGALVALALATLWVVDRVPGAGGPVRGGGVVRWLDTGGRDVMVLEDDARSGTTLIWLLDAEVGPGASVGRSDEVV
ncbi:hypothetical protein MK489_21345 [Myxococcota bacterium]|nr:hypothetical protein [Myxococcota bacterium]